MLKYIPNTLSLSRIPLSAVFFWAATEDLWELATAIFMIALVTDGLDGWFARRFNVTSKLGGEILEPFCDLALSIAVIAGLYVDGVLPLWVPIVLAALTGLLQLSHATPFNRLKRHTFYLYPLFFCVVIVVAGAGVLEHTYPGNAALMVIYMMTWLVVAVLKLERITEWLNGPPSAGSPA